MSHSTCTTPGCERPTQSRGLCRTHYSAWYRATHRKQATCHECGTTCLASRPEYKYCTPSCAGRANQRTAQASPNMHAWREQQKAEAAERAKQPKPAKPVKPRKDMRGPLRKAYEDGDMQGIIEALKSDVIINSDGCWEWQRRIGKDGYAEAKIGDKRHYVHRLMSFAHYGEREDVPVVHHMCANRVCCNPKHLQPVTHRDNIAEMLERNYYLRRIAELETALAEVEPDHSLLGR